MAKLFALVLILMILIGMVGLYRLPVGWVSSSLQATLTDTFGPTQLVVPQAQLRWGGWRHPLGVRVTQVSVKQEQKDFVLQIPTLILSLKVFPLLQGKAEVGRCDFEDVRVYSKDRLLGNLSGEVKIRRSKLSFHGAFQSLDVVAWIYRMSGQDCPEGAFLPLKGKLVLEGNRKVGLTQVDLFCESEGGKLSIPGLYPLPVLLDHVSFSLKGSGQTFMLKHFSLKQGNAVLDIQGKVHSPVSWKSLYEGGGKIQASLKGQGASIPIDDLALLWPQGLSPKPRHWVTHHLSKGKADRVRVQVDLSLSVDAGGKLSGIEVPDIHGDIDASGITVDYFGQLPPVVDTKGRCHFTRQQFIIDAVGLANGIQLKRGKIIIHGLHVKDQTIDINLDLEGSLRNSLEIIAAAPLRLPQKLDLDPARISGHATTHLQLDFPLETYTTLDHVNVRAYSEIGEAEIIAQTQLKGKPIKLDKGKFALEVTKESLNMKGKGNIQGVPAQIQWREYFVQEKSPFRRQFEVQGDVDLSKQLTNFGLDMADYLGGKALAQFLYTVDASGKGVVEGTMDLTPAIMVSPALPWQKDKGEPADLKLKIITHPDKPDLVLESAMLKAPHLTLMASGRKDSHREYLEINHLQVGNSHLKATLHRYQPNLLNMALRGKVLDLSYILNDSASEPLLKPVLSQGEAGQSEVKVYLHLDKVILGDSQAIQQVSGEMVYGHGALRMAQLEGKTLHHHKTITLNMAPLAPRQQQFILTSQDGGHLLEMLGAGYDVEGGHLTIRGIKTEKEKGWEVTGSMSIDDFTINKAPLLARLLSMASLQGIVNVFSGQGIHFYTGTANFTLTPETLVLKKGRFISPSLGILLDGHLDRLHQQVHFEGELSPLYVLNALLAQIPLISGGREDGVFMTRFTLTGNRHAPQLTVNPITTVTPGLMREFLTKQGGQGH